MVFSAASAALGYVRRNPAELGRAALGLFGLRIGVPLAALDWLATVALAGAVEDPVIEPVPPGLRIGGSFELMATPIRAQVVILVEKIEISEQSLAFCLRFDDIEVLPLGVHKTQLSALLRATALDLSRPGDLIANFPGIPSFLLDAQGNRVTVDLMRMPAIRELAPVRGLIGLLSSIITLAAVEAEGHHLDIVLRPLPEGLGGPPRRLRALLESLG